MSEQVVCDICGSSTTRSASYHLPTRHVVISEAYWRSAFQLVVGMMSALGRDERAQAGVFDELISQSGNSGTPWLVCEECSEWFVFDRPGAREHARRGTAPEGSGPVAPSGFAPFAAAAWEHVVGRWPASVQQPAVIDTCDFCAKKIYQGELCGRIGTEAAEAHLASGVLQTPPLSPPRPAQQGWLSCLICTSRVQARVDRARGDR
ncbi:hypothetical protein [Streptomyces koyangensis]|uniref:C2H2-type domain-containing protein n=1 Tax=Streptomyces koyangensis TaxID=188770 RepID=A0ABX7ELF0_9ACTN|nr:hypothetical protein [Streptomyces koyangensis]QRF05359.1 hypothetical protein G9U55_26480 [Streptomyces koyangensis]